MQQPVNSEENAEPFNHALTSNAPDVDINALQDAVNELIAVPGLVSNSSESPFSVDVSKDGHWWVLEGTVNSQATRAAIFSLIPGRDGRRFIIDRIQVTYE